MKIYDISQEVFNCKVYPGDPMPKKSMISQMDKGDLYNLTEFSMCAHNGTHVDSPYHFINDGKSIDKVFLEAFVGMCYVANHNGIVSAVDAVNILNKAKSYGVEVASLAGLPNEIISRSKELISNFENEKQQSKTEKDSEIINILKETDLNRLTPIAAFETLTHLKNLIK